MPDEFGTRLRTYLDSVAPPITAEEAIERAEGVRPVRLEGEPVGRRRRTARRGKFDLGPVPGVVRLLAAMMVVVLVVGGAWWLFGGPAGSPVVGEPAPEGEAPPPDTNLSPEDAEQIPNRELREVEAHGLVWKLTEFGSPEGRCLRVEAHRDTASVASEQACSLFPNPSSQQADLSTLRLLVEQAFYTVLTGRAGEEVSAVRVEVGGQTVTDTVENQAWLVVLRGASPELRSFATLGASGGVLATESLATSAPVPGGEGLPELPLEPLVRMVEDSPETHAAIQAAIAECMAARGFEYEAAPYYPLDLLNLDRRYLLRDVERARTYGYGSPEQEQEPDRPGINPAYAALPPEGQQAWSEAFSGTEEITVRSLAGDTLSIGVGGCLDEGESTVYGDRVAHHELIANLEALANQSYGLAEKDPVVQGALAAWRTCMEEKGLQVSDLEAWRASAVGNPQEVEMAVAEAECNELVRLAETWSRAEADIQGYLLREHEEALVRLMSKIGLSWPEHLKP